MNRIALAAGCALLALAPPPLRADTPGPGYQLALQPSPAFAPVTCTLPGGDFVTFDGLTVDRWTAGGQFVANLFTFFSYSFPSFAVCAPGGDAVVIGESSSGSLFLVQTDGSGGSFLLQLPFNYDAAFLPSGDLAVSAALSGFGAGNDLVRVQLSPPRAFRLGRVDGPSGPVAVSASGGLYYATQASTFPPPPGSTSVVFWTAQQVAQGGLGEGNATVLATGFDGGASLAIDPSTGRAYLAEVNFGLGVYRIVRVAGHPSLDPLVVEGTDPVSNLEFVRGGTGPATFDPWQPGDGWNLKYNATDFSSRSEIGTVRPARPVLTGSGPGLVGQGQVTLSVTGAMPNGVLFLAFCPQDSIAPSEHTVAFPNFLFHTPFDLSRTRRMPFLLSTDGDGNGSFGFWNPGDLQGQLGYQFLIGDASGRFFGSTNAFLF